MSLSNTLYRHAATLDAAQAAPRFGIVASIDTTAHCAKVLIQPENVLTGWLPMGVQGVGQNSGVVAPYSAGDQVLVIPTQGSIEQGVIMCGIYSDSQLPPQVPSTPNGDPTHTDPGGLTIVRGGASMRFNLDGSIITTGTWNHVGTFNVTGKINATGIITSAIDVIAGAMKSLVNHIHRDSRGGNTTSPL